MATVVRNTTISRPPDEVFAYLDDLEAHREWEGGVEEARVLTGGPTRVGSEAEQTRIVGMGQRIEMRWRVTEHEPAARRVSYEAVDSPAGSISVALSVAPADGGSEVTCEMSASPPVEVGELINRRMTRELKKSVAGDLKRLKERLEAGATAGSS